MHHSQDGRVDALDIGGTVSIGVLFVLLMQGCSSTGQTSEVTRRDTTYSRPTSPYTARVTVVTREETDTTYTPLSDHIVMDVRRSERCLQQEVVLRAKKKMQSDAHVLYLRARDTDCQQPEAVRWESLRLRGRLDRQRWNESSELRRATKEWLRTYLAEMYFDFPVLN